MWLKIDSRSAEPIYLQIIRGIKASVAKGVLKAGDKLSSVRELSAELTVNHNTVAKAYQELERDGVIEVVRGRGTFIREAAVPTDVDERLDAMKTSVWNLLVEAHHLGMDGLAFKRWVGTVVDAWQTDKERDEHA